MDCHVLLLGDLPEPLSLASPACAGGFFAICTTWEAPLNFFTWEKIKVATFILYCDVEYEFYVQDPINHVNFFGSYHDEDNYLNSITFKQSHKICFLCDSLT